MGREHFDGRADRPSVKTKPTFAPRVAAELACLTFALLFGRRDFILAHAKAAMTQRSRLMRFDLKTRPLACVSRRGAF
jgi:hypothetical protein